MLFRIVAAFAFGYFLSYVFRVVNAVAGLPIIADLGLDAGALGLLTSVYFLAFAATQIPLGVALDRYGPRVVEPVLLVVASAGALVFATAEGVAGLIVGRALIGVGVSAGLMAAFKAYTMTAAPERLPLINGIHLSAGALGALAGGIPAEFLMAEVGWRGLFLILAALPLMAALLIAVFGPKWHGGVHGETIGAQLRAVGAIFRNRRFLIVAALCVPNHATGLAVQGLWAGPWLREVAGFGPELAATVLSVMAAAMMAGFLVLGGLATRIARQRQSPMTFAVGTMIVFMVVQATLIVMPPWTSVPVWCLYAFFATGGILVFPALAATFPKEQAGRVNTALNFLVFVASFVIQWMVGVALASFGPALGIEGAFDAAFSALLALQLAGLIVVLRGQRAAGRDPR